MLFTDVELWPKQLFVLNGYLTWCFLLLLFIIFNFGCRMSCKHCYWSTIIFWGWYFHWVCLAVDIFVNSFHCIVSVFIGQRDVWYGPDSSYGQHCSRWRECSSLLHLSKTRHKLLHDVRQISPNMLSQRICMCPNWELNLDQIFFFFPPQRLWQLQWVVPWSLYKCDREDGQSYQGVVLPTVSESVINDLKYLNMHFIIL